jgi:hypothetical protein
MAALLSNEKLSDLVFSPRVMTLRRPPLVGDVASRVGRDKFILDRPREHAADSFDASVSSLGQVRFTIPRDPDGLGCQSAEKIGERCGRASKAARFPTRVAPPRAANAVFGAPATAGRGPALRALLIPAHGCTVDAPERRSAPWEVAAQLGHGVGKAYAVSERYAAYGPDYLSGAVEALDGLIRLTVCGPVRRKRRGKPQ